MTPETTRTDQEIIEACAKLMGWKKIGEPHPILPHDITFWINPKNGKKHVAPPGYLTDWNHTMEVAEQVRSQGLIFSIKWRPNIEASVLFLDRNKVKGEAVDNPQRAICLAALKAVESLPKE